MTRENRQYHSFAAAMLPMLLYALFRLPVGIVLPDVQNDFDLSNWTAGVVLGSKEGKCPTAGATDC